MEVVFVLFVALTVQVLCTSAKDFSESVVEREAILRLRASALLAKKPDVFLNEWAVQIHGGVDVAKRVARQTGFEYVSNAGPWEIFHVFRHPDQPEENGEHAEEKTEQLANHSEIIWAEQQVLEVLYTTSSPHSDLSLSSSASMPGQPYALPTDPWYRKQWNYRRRIQDPKPAWDRGFTGQGVTVCVVDTGVQHTHPDLQGNYDSDASYDVVNSDTDPAPAPPSLLDDHSHGTRCAGEIAAEVNDNCVAGVAYNASFGAIRLLNAKGVSDLMVSSSLSFKPQLIDIYTNSWGISGNGFSLSGPGRLTQHAMADGVKNGRNGLGSIYTKSAGNGRANGDMCGCEGYVNSVETIVVTAMDSNGQSSWYAEHCAAVMVTAYSSGSRLGPHIASTDINSGCTDKHSGTSAAAPVVAGVIALALQANPQLNWRDVQHILALTSRIEQPDNAWWFRSRTTNAAGYTHSNEFGFGLIHPAGVVNLARHWTTVPGGRVCTEANNVFHGSVPRQSTHTFTFQATGCPFSWGREVRYIEHAVAIISAHSVFRGSIAFDLVSPQGTRTTLLTHRRKDILGSFVNWRFLTVALWGENPNGEWKLVATAGRFTVYVTSFQLEIHGTYTQPAITSLPAFSQCHAECYDGCVGYSSSQCHSCKHHTVFRTDGSFDCVSKCPDDLNGSRCTGSHQKTFPTTTEPFTTMTTPDMSRTAAPKTSATTPDMSRTTARKTSATTPETSSNTVVIALATSAGIVFLCLVVAVIVAAAWSKRRDRSLHAFHARLVNDEGEIAGVDSSDW